MKKNIIKYLKKFAWGILFIIIAPYVLDFWNNFSFTVQQKGLSFWEFVQHTWQSNWDYIIDYPYIRAAYFNTFFLIKDTLDGIFIATILVFIAFIIMISLRERFEFYKNLVERAKKSGIKSDDVINAQKKLDEVKKIIYFFKKPSDKLSFFNTPFFIFIQAVVFILLLLMTYLQGYYFPAKWYHDYQLDIIQILPYLEENKVKELNASWVSMKGKDDYDAIYKIINDIKKEKNLTRGKQKQAEDENKQAEVKEN